MIRVRVLIDVLPDTFSEESGILTISASQSESEGLIQHTTLLPIHEFHYAEKTPNQFLKEIACAAVDNLVKT